MYTQAGLGAVGPLVFDKRFQPEPTGHECFHGWFFPIGYPLNSPGRTLMDHQTLRPEYQVLGYMEGVRLWQQTRDQLRSRNDGRYQIAVVGRVFTGRFAYLDEAGTMIQPDPGPPGPSAPMASFLNWLGRGGSWTSSRGGIFTICGPLFTGPEGNDYVVIDSWEDGPHPHLEVPDKITIAGTLSTCSPPGISQVWPCLEGRYVSTGKWDSAEANRFVKMWNAGEIGTGAELSITGYPTTVRGQPGIIPTLFRIKSAGTPVDDPGKVDFPERPDPVDMPPPGFDPDDPDPDPWNLLDPEDEAPPYDPGTDLMPIPTGGDDGWGDTIPFPGGDNGGEALAPRIGAGLSMPMVITGLLLLPLLFGNKKRDR